MRESDDGMAEGTATVERDRKDVNRTIRVLEGDLPPQPVVERGSVLETQLDALKEMKDAYGKWACISDYGKPSGASSALVVLRSRHGKDQTIDGFVFASRKIDGGKRTGLFASYDPSKIVKGAKEKYLAERKTAKEAAAAKATENGGGK